MKKMRKIFAVLLTLAMVIAMSIPTFATEKSATITVTGLDKNATVTYKQIIEPDDTTATGWKFTDGVDYANAFGNSDAQAIIWKLLKMNSGSEKMTNEPDSVVPYSAQEFAAAIGKISTSSTVNNESGQPKKSW